MVSRAGNDAFAAEPTSVLENDRPLNIEVAVVSNAGMRFGEQLFQRELAVLNRF